MRCSTSMASASCCEDSMVGTVCWMYLPVKSSARAAGMRSSAPSVPPFRAVAAPQVRNAMCLLGDPDGARDTVTHVFQIARQQRAVGAVDDLVHRARLGGLHRRIGHGDGTDPEVRE